MKYLLVLIVVLVGVWMLLRGRAPTVNQGKSKQRAGRDAPASMVACTHCGLHLPQQDAITDGAGRAYCSDAHRLAGPP